MTIIIMVPTWIYWEICAIIDFHYTSIFNITFSSLSQRTYVSHFSKIDFLFKAYFFKGFFHSIFWVIFLILQKIQVQIHLKITVRLKIFFLKYFALFILKLVWIRSGFQLYIFDSNIHKIWQLSLLNLIQLSMAISTITRFFYKTFQILQGLWLSMSTQQFLFLLWVLWIFLNSFQKRIWKLFKLWINQIF